ncbi:MAG: HEAT repeat domain-containing protein [Pseudomonadota bacterium]
MNCSDISLILDDRDTGTLDDGLRKAADAHVAECRDCARDWKLHTRLVARKFPALPPDLLDECSALAVSSPAALGTRRKGSHAALITSVPTAGRRANRKLLWGSLIVLAAAAATVVPLSMQNAQTGPEATARVVQSEAPRVFDVAPAMMAPETAVPAKSLETVPGVIIEAVAAPLFTVRVALPDPPRAEQAAMRAALKDPAVQEVLQSLRAALVAELRKVPGLAVLDKDPTEITPASRHYRLRIGPDLTTSIDGRIYRWQHGYTVDLTAQELQPGGTSTQRLAIGALVGVDSIATCTGVAPAEDRPCPSVPETAAELVHTLRQEVFPPDSSVTRPLQARVGDPLLAPEERFKSFAELCKQQSKSEGKSLLSDKEVVRAAVELARLTDPVHRAQIWRAMRGISDALLVEPLLTSLQLDPEEVRIAAIETLAADFSGDRRAQLALEAAAIADPRPLVRAVAQRGLTGEEGWRTYVASSLKNSGLPDSQRVEALMYALYPPYTLENPSGAANPNFSPILKGFDDAAVRALVELFPRADVFRSGPSSNLLANFAYLNTKNPAVTELLLNVLVHDSKALNREAAGKVLAEVHLSEPRVREALTKAISSDPDPSVRDDIRQYMEWKGP